MARTSKTLTPAAMAAFLAALEGGALVEAAAAAAGVAVSSLYWRRERDPAFAAAWDAAVAASAGPVLVWNQAGRRWQKQRSRRVRFTRERKQAFLDHFAGSCNLAAAAEAAGVSAATVYEHLRRDPAFAEAFQEALALGYTLIEAEAAGQMRAAQEKYRIHPDPDAAAMAMSFDQCLKLLRQWKRRDGTLSARQVSRGHLKRWSFDDAIRALDKKLRALGLRHGIPDDDPPPAESRARAGAGEPGEGLHLPGPSTRW